MYKTQQTSQRNYIDLKRYVPILSMFRSRRLVIHQNETHCSSKWDQLFFKLQNRNIYCKKRDNSICLRIYANYISLYLRLIS